MSQLIVNKIKSYTFNFNGFDCTFISMALFIGNNLTPAKPFMRKNKAILYWKVGGKQISYNHVKKLIK